MALLARVVASLIHYFGLTCASVAIDEVATVQLGLRADTAPSPIEESDEKSDDELDDVPSDFPPRWSNSEMGVESFSRSVLAGPEEKRTAERRIKRILERERIRPAKQRNRDREAIRKEVEADIQRIDKQVDERIKLLNEEAELDKVNGVLPANIQYRLGQDTARVFEEADKAKKRIEEEARREVELISGVERITIDEEKNLEEIKERYERRRQVINDDQILDETQKESQLLEAENTRDEEEKATKKLAKEDRKKLEKSLKDTEKAEDQKAKKKDVATLVKEVFTAKCKGVPEGRECEVPGDVIKFNAGKIKDLGKSCKTTSCSIWNDYGVTDCLNEKCWCRDGDQVVKANGGTRRCGAPTRKLMVAVSKGGKDDVRVIDGVPDPSQQLEDALLAGLQEPIDLRCDGWASSGKKKPRTFPPCQAAVQPYHAAPLPLVVLEKDVVASVMTIRQWRTSLIRLMSVMFIYSVAVADNTEAVKRLGNLLHTFTGSFSNSIVKRTTLPPLEFPLGDPRKESEADRTFLIEPSCAAPITQVISTNFDSSAGLATTWLDLKPNVPCVRDFVGKTVQVWARTRQALGNSNSPQGGAATEEEFVRETKRFLTFLVRRVLCPALIVQEGPVKYQDAAPEKYPNFLNDYGGKVPSYLERAAGAEEEAARDEAGQQFRVALLSEEEQEMAVSRLLKDLKNDENKESAAETRRKFPKELIAPDRNEDSCAKIHVSNYASKFGTALFTQADLGLRDKEGEAFNPQGAKLDLTIRERMRDLNQPTQDGDDGQKKKPLPEEEREANRAVSTDEVFVPIHLKKVRDGTVPKQYLITDVLGY